MKPGLTIGKTPDGSVKMTLTGPITAKDIAKLHSKAANENLAIGNLTADNLDFLAPLQSLKSLELYNVRVANWQAIARLKKLNRLFINGIEPHDNIQWIGELRTITELSLLYLPKLKALPRFAPLSKIEKITLWQCKRLKDIQAMASLRKLKQAKLVDTPHVPKDLIFLLKMPSIQSVTAVFATTKMNDEFKMLHQKYVK